MNDRVEISIYRFTAWSGEVYDPEMDVRGERPLGFFTWRASTQPRPELFDAIRLHATFRELADIDVLALNIRDFFPWKVSEAESTRIATGLVAKISHAMAATQPGRQLAYVHSERYPQLVAAARTQRLFYQ